MSQSPLQPTSVDANHPYAQATSQLNKLVRMGRSFSGHERNCCYLNDRQGKFANASAVSGLDFPDDGRCVVRCDWDHDGDLDLWVSNRSAPRVRFLRNDFAATKNKAGKNNFVAFRLTGTKSNRDAIGAQVTITLAEPDNPDDDANRTVLSRTVRRGEGFLGQSSSTVHFGLGNTSTVRQLTVRWPNGENGVVEEFPLPASDNGTGFFELVEGSGETNPWPPAASNRNANDAIENANKNAVAESIANQNKSRPPETRHLLSQSAPLPPLLYKPFSQEAAASKPAATKSAAIQPMDATQNNRKPTLLNLWASWCEPCVKELNDWSNQSNDSNHSQLNIIALSVDGLDQPGPRDDKASRALIDRTQFPQVAGLASPRLVELLQLVNNMVYQNDHRPLPIPTSFLIDKEGRLAAIYKGPVSLDQIQRDLTALSSSTGEQRLRATAPFPGRWIAAPPVHRVGKLAAAMWESGFGSEAVEMANRVASHPRLESPGCDYRAELLKMRWANATHLRNDPQQLQATEQQLQAMLKSDPNHTDATIELGVLAARTGDLPKAAKFFQQAVTTSNPPSAAAHFNFAKALRQLGKPNEAVQQLKTAIQVDPSFAPAQSMLGHLFVSEKDFKQAALHFSAAWQHDPSNMDQLMNLVSALMQTGEVARAHDELQSAVTKNPQAISVRGYLAQVLLEMKKPELAIQQLEEIVKVQPAATKVWYQLGQLAQQQGEWENALNHTRRFAKLTPNDPVSESELAWLLATVPEDSLRNGKLALQLANKAATTTQQRDARVLEVLAAAYAELGDFENAVQSQRKANQLSSSSNEKRKAELKERLEQYLRKQPHRLAP